MKIRIYFGNKSLFLTDTIDDELAVHIHHDDAVFIDELSSPGINSMIHEMRLQKVHAGIYFHKDLEALRKAFWKKFVLVKAAGGLVLNDEKKILLIRRRGKWDLPKGKADKGETLEQCALREVKEETGLNDVRLEAPLLVTYHTYDENGKHILKESHWYRMLAPGPQQLHPQAEEDIQEVRWVQKPELTTCMQNTFPSILDVMKTAGSL